MFGAWIGRIVKTYDYINRVVITLPLTVYEGTWTITLPSRCYTITMILRVRRNFFEITTFPNRSKLPLPLTSLAGDGRTDYLSSPIARGPSGRPPNGAAGAGTPRGAGEEGR